MFRRPGASGLSHSGTLTGGHGYARASKHDDDSGSQYPAHDYECADDLL
jgi:hypothetical protein